jgi:hypothetical protein
MAVSLALAAVLMPAIALTVSRVFSDNGRSTRVMQTLKNVENGGYWISRDAMTSQSATSVGFPLTLTWQDWDGNSHEVTYSLSGTTLQRTVLINSVLSTTTVVAHDISSDPVLTDCQFLAGVLTFRLTSVIDSTVETGEFQITLRPTSPESGV